MKLDHANGELPRIDDRFIGYKYQHAYYASTLNQDLLPVYYDSISHYAFKAEQKKSYQLNSGSLCIEPLFVPKNLQAKEGDGYLLSYVYHQQQSRSDLIILNTNCIEDGPVATIQFPHRVPFGPHGCWAQGITLDID